MRMKHMEVIMQGWEGGTRPPWWDLRKEASEAALELGGCVGTGTVNAGEAWVGRQAGRQEAPFYFQLISEVTTGQAGRQEDGRAGREGE